MFILGPKSQANLTQVHPKLVSCVLEAIQNTTQDFAVEEGVRHIQEEIQNIANGNSHLTDPTHCKHCVQKSGYGEAVDLVAVVDKKLTWDWNYVWPVVHAMKIAEAKHGIKLRWGGVWDRTLDELSDNLEAEVDAYKARRKALGKKPFLDGVHFEIILQNDAPNDGASQAIIA